MKRRNLSDSEARWEAVVFIDAAVRNFVDQGAVTNQGEKLGWTDADMDASGAACVGASRRADPPAQEPQGGSMTLDLEAIKRNAMVFRGTGSAEDSLAAMRSARDVPELVAEVERLRNWLKTTQDCADQRFKDSQESTASVITKLIDENERLRAAIRDCSGSCDV